jgi:hypothetical protein
MDRVRKCCLTEILATRQDESCTLHFQLGLTKFFKFNIFAMMELIEIFRNIFCIHQKFTAHFTLKKQQSINTKITFYYLLFMIRKNAFFEITKLIKTILLMKDQWLG